MDKYVCDLCGYIYDPAEGDPDNGVAPGTPWEQVPADWVCPLCGVGKDQFSKQKVFPRLFPPVRRLCRRIGGFSFSQLYIFIHSHKI